MLGNDGTFHQRPFFSSYFNRILTLQHLSFYNKDTTSENRKPPLIRLRLQLLLCCINTNRFALHTSILSSHHRRIFSLASPISLITSFSTLEEQKPLRISYMCFAIAYHTKNAASEVRREVVGRGGVCQEKGSRELASFTN